MSRVFGRLRIVLGILVALAMLLPAGGWVLDRLAVRSAGGDVQEALGDDAGITDSLLLVRSVDCAGRSRSGSAFSLDLDGVGVVITNRHVVDAARSTVVQPLDAGPGMQVREVLLSAAADVAVLVLDDEAVPPTLPTGPTASLGQPILTVGFPGARPALREGRVDRVEPARLLLALEVGAGASGSPVLDDEGRVVGQVFARTQDGRGVATPIRGVRLRRHPHPAGRGKASGSLHEVKPVTLVTGLLHELQARNPGSTRRDRRPRARRRRAGRRPGRVHRPHRGARAGLPEPGRRRPAQPLLRLRPRGRQPGRGAGALRLGGPDRRRRRRVDVAGADGLRRRPVGDGPGDQPTPPGSCRRASAPT
jgi:S1-C subfamily serine protease